MDEGGSGGVKLIDIADDTAPRIANSIKLEINLPENQDTALACCWIARSPTTTRPR